ncbi:MAG: phage recombination protein Bet [Rectinemataceae bacterium]
MQNLSPFPAPVRELPPTMPAVPEIRKETVLDFLKAFGLATQLTESEKLQFIEIAQAFGLNPFKREVHVAVYGEGEYRKLSIITGYEVYLKRADRTGKLDGWRAWIDGEGEAMKAMVEIHRKDWSQSFVHEVYWREAVQKKRDGSPTSFWTKQPRFQLKKVAISQGFRLAFPDELGGMPYDAAELPDAETIAPSTPMPVETPKSVQPSTPAPAISLIRQVDVPPAPVSRPEPRSIPAPVSVPVPIVAPDHPFGSHDRYPDESADALFDRLECYMDNNFEAFTEKHREWVLDKARKSRDREGVLKMIGYAEKVIRNVSAVAGATA